MPKNSRTHDIALRGGIVVDGTGTPAFGADVGIRGGRIEAIGPAIGPSREEIDCTGLTVAPGFIDVHAHSDLSLLDLPEADSKVRQGVTTEVNGNCGWSAAPLRGEARSWILEKASQLGLRSEHAWEHLDGYFGRLEVARPALNTALLTGFGNLRVAAMGFSRRAASKSQLSRMKAWYREALDQGAVGLSSGLYFSPESAATAEEVASIAQVGADTAAVYASHVRDEGAQTIGVVAAIREAVEIGRQAGVPVQLSHLKAIGPLAWGLATSVLGEINVARAKGEDVTADVYAYTETGGNLQSALVPPWALEGGRLALVSRLRDATDRERIRKAVIERLPLRGGPERLMVRACAFDRSLEGKNLAGIATAMVIEVDELVLRMLEHENVKLISLALDESDVRRFLKHPHVMICSDGMVMTDTGPLSQVHTHPRTYGAFPRVLSRYVRGESVLTLEEAVRKMTSLPAAKFGFADRGRLAEGEFADVTVFDSETVNDTATLTRPHSFPIGIYHVLVNGVVTVRDGESTGQRGGQVIRGRHRA